MLFPHTKSRRIVLRPAGTADAPAAYEILFRLGTAGLPLIDDYTASFGDRLSACFLVERADGGEVIGVSTLSSLQPAGHLRMEVHVAAEASGEDARDAHALTANFAFAMWRTRKVYVHLTSADASVTGFGDEHLPLLRPEAVLPDHVYVHGELRDLHVLAVHREDWDGRGADLVQQIV